MQFLNDLTGYSCGKGNVKKTTNGGDNWTNIPVTNSGLNSVYFLNEQSGWCCGKKGEIFKTTNGGTNWSFQSAGFYTSSIFLSIKFVDANTGWVVGENGSILKTTTGGNVFISQTSTEVPDNFSLHQNYPNPFNPSTSIKFDIKKQGITELKVYDLNGKLIETLVDEPLPVGSYEVTFNVSALSSGVYFYVLKTNEFVESKKMILVK